MVDRHFGTRELPELEESLGTPFVEWSLQGRPGMKIVPEGHWCRMVARSHPSWSFGRFGTMSREERIQRSKIAVKGQDTDTSSIGISLCRR